MKIADYDILVSALMEYFETKKFPVIQNQIKVGKVNKKKFGWALNQINQSVGNGILTIEYLRFAKNHISLFSDVGFNELDFVKSNLYKYFTTKTE